MRAAAREFALPPTRQERFIDGQQVPPGDDHAIGIGLEIGAPGRQIEVRHIRAVAVQQDDPLEPVVGQRLRDVEHLPDEGLVVRVDRARKIHDVPGISVGEHRQDEHLLRKLPSGSVRNADGTHEIDIKW